MARNAGAADVAEGAGPDAESARVLLAPEIDFVGARGLHAELSRLRDAADVVFEAADVKSLSTAAVLVIVSFLNARAGRTPPAAVVNPSGPFVDAFSELGLFGSLMRMEFRT